MTAFDPARLTVFCGSSRGTRATYAGAARAFGRLLARQGLGLVYGGGRVGLMGEVADAVLGAGGEAIGVIPEALARPEVAHHGLTALHVVDSMHTRKRMMADLGGGFVALPGGMGTFEELMEILTWAQLEIHRKPVGILDVAGYYQPLVRLFDHAVEEGFLRPEHRALLVVADDGEALLARMADAARALRGKVPAPRVEP